jgi:hypothetical protein
VNDTNDAPANTVTPINGVAYLEHQLTRALRMVDTFGVSLNDIDEVLREALDVVVGHCGPHMRICPAPPHISWFAVRDGAGATVVEHMPSRDVPYYAVSWSDDYGHAALVAKLLGDNETRDDRRVDIMRGERLPPVAE